MGEGFCETAKQALQAQLSRDDEAILQNLQWGLELVLKAYLHTHGWDD